MKKIYNLDLETCRKSYKIFFFHIHYFSFINSKCYYFEKDAPGSFDKAQNYCNGIFGENMAGKIFEPRDPYTNEVVLKEAEEVMGCTCYSFIGVQVEVFFLKEIHILI